MKPIALIVAMALMTGCAAKKPIKYIWHNCVYWNEDTPSSKVDHAVTCQIPVHK